MSKFKPNSHFFATMCLLKGYAMTLIIENVKEEFLPAFKGLAKGVQARLKAKRSDKEIAAEWKKEVGEMMEDYKAGRIKAFSSIEELKKDLES